jgi:hypothetical protein
LKKRLLAAGVLALFTGIATAAPRLESLSVKTAAARSTDVVISVSIERPTPLDLNCDAVIEAGDGSKFMMSWGIGDRRTKTARYEYKKPGSYRVKVSGTGKDACVGVKEATVTVGGGAAAKDARASTSRCPSGWMLVEESVKGGRYTCRAKPPAQPLRCAEGTTYFAERGEIGCR